MLYQINDTNWSKFHLQDLACMSMKCNKLFDQSMKKF